MKQSKGNKDNFDFTDFASEEVDITFDQIDAVESFKPVLGRKPERQSSAPTESKVEGAEFWGLVRDISSAPLCSEFLALEYYTEEPYEAVWHENRSHPGGDSTHSCGDGFVDVVHGYPCEPPFWLDMAPEEGADYIQLYVGSTVPTDTYPAQRTI